MPADSLIRWREMVLNRSLGIRGNEVLNAVPPVPAARSPLDVAAGLTRAVNALRAAAGISPQGHLDYARLQQSTPYLEYRQAWAGAPGRGNRGHPYIPDPQFGPSDLRCAFVVRPPDARIHFALNCGSRSCPPVGAYEAGRIEAHLDLAARSFVGATVTVDRERRTVHLSPIFRWFACDFGGRRGVVAFLLQHLPVGERREWLATHRDRLSLAYQPYDWGLNAVQA